VASFYIGWKSWKLIARTISSTPSLFFLAQRASTYSQGNMGTFWGDKRCGGKKWHASPMGTGRWFNVVSWVKYGRDIDAVIHNVVSTSIIRRRNITEYPTSSRRCDLEHIRRHRRQSNPTSISSQNDVVAGHLLMWFTCINKCMKTKGNKKQLVYKILL